MNKLVPSFLAVIASLSLFITACAQQQEEGKEDVSSKRSFTIPEKEFEMFGKQTTDEDLRAKAGQSGMLETGRPVTELEGKPQIRLVRASTPAVLPVFGVAAEVEEVEVVAMIDGTSKVLGAAKKISGDKFSFVFETSGTFQLMVRTENKISKVFKLKVLPSDSPFLYMPREMQLKPGQVVELVGDNFTEQSKFFFGAKKVESTIESENLIKAVLPEGTPNGVIRVWNPGRKNSNGILYYVQKKSD